MFLAADLAGILATPEVSPVSQAISELMERDAPAKGLVDPLLVMYHGLVIPFAGRLDRSLPSRLPGPLGPRLIGLVGLAGVILTLFCPCDPGCALFVSLQETLHIFIAIPMGFAILNGIWLTGRRQRSRPLLARHGHITAGLGLCLAVLTVAPAETDAVGLVERVLTWSYLLWYATTGLVFWYLMR